ncbi:MAG TPA: hypothetical protein GX708_24190 [Gallicola sp.]|nr:hypothetical protein [Gallicola sp.]
MSTIDWDSIFEKYTDGVFDIFVNKNAIYGFSNDRNIMIIHDYSKTKTDVDDENYILCLEITSTFDLSAYIELLSSSKTFENLLNHEIGDELVSITWQYGTRGKQENSNDNTEIKPYLKSLEFDVTTITSEEFTDATKLEGGLIYIDYHRLDTSVVLESSHKNLDIVSKEGESWYIVTYEVVEGDQSNHQYYMITSDITKVKNKIQSMFE